MVLKRCTHCGTLDSDLVQFITLIDQYCSCHQISTPSSITSVQTLDSNWSATTVDIACQQVAHQSELWTNVIKLTALHTLHLLLDTVRARLNYGP